jgi:hypothetical protein
MIATKKHLVQVTRALGAVALLMLPTLQCAEGDMPGTGGGQPGSDAGAGDVAGTGGQSVGQGGGIDPVDSGGNSTGGAGGTTGGGGAGGMVVSPPPKGDVAIDGPLGGAYEYKAHHPFRLTFDGPMTTDAGTPNPFLDFRLSVMFKTPGGKTFVVPGYFAADGNGGSAGNKWRVHFNPPEVGSYTYTVSFHSAAGIALLADPTVGTAMPPDARTGAFNIGPTDKQAPDFRATGKLAYVKQHYLRTIGDGKIWLKTGSNSPENILGYAGFANTTDGPGGIAKNFLHQFAPHVADWKTGDPDWGGGKGKGFIGVINYYASAGVNQMNAMTLTMNGDGDDVVPFINRTDRQRFDNAKLQQWEIAFSHADTKGVAIHFFLCEAESYNLLGPTVNGKIYYREMIARFAHHGGVLWNLGEENGYSTAVRKEIAGYLMSLDPYRSVVSSHTGVGTGGRDYPPLMGDPNITATSIQDAAGNAVRDAANFRSMSAAANLPWVVMYDEITPAGSGVTDCPTAGTGNCDSLRRDMIWPFLLSGGGGFEWYSGYNNVCDDVKCENLRLKAMIFQYSRVAREFLIPLPLDEMAAGDNLVGGGAKVWFKKGAVYAIYLPTGGSAHLNLTGDSGPFRMRFYNVIDGTYGPAMMVAGGGMVSLAAPPFPGDVAVLLERM